MKRMRAVIVGTVVAVVALAYSNSVHCGFAFDDSAAVVKNPDVNPASPLSALLHRDFWGQEIAGPHSHKSYRPLTVLSFRLNRLFAEHFYHAAAAAATAATTAGKSELGNGDDSETSVFSHTPERLAGSFHAVNVALHAAVSLLLFYVALETFGCDDLQAGAAALLFAAHPVHTEAVTGIVGRADELCALFCLLSLLCFARGCRARAWLWTTLCIACVGAATLCKELGVTFVGVLLVYDLVIASELLPELSLDSFKKLRSSAPRAKRFAARQALIFGVAFLLLWVRKRVTVSFGASGHFRALENPIMMTSGLDFVLSVGALCVKYAQLLVFPAVLSADWSYNAVPLVTSLSDPRNVLSMALLLALIVSCLLCMVWLRRGGKFDLVALAWLVATFVPATNIFFFVGTMVGERLLYVPSVGFCIVIGRLLGRGARRGVWPPIRVVCMALVVVAVAAGTWRSRVRNPDWMDNETLFRRTVEDVPESAKAQMMYGEELQSQGRWKESVPYLRRAKEIWPDYCDVDHSLGASLYQLGEFTAGIALMQKGLDCWPSRVSAAKNLHAIYTELLRRDPGNVAVLLGWADVLSKIEREDEAAHEYVAIGVRFWEAGDRKHGLELVQKACALDPKQCEAQLWSGVMLLETDPESEEAIEHLAASSFKENCSQTHLHALDKLAGIYTRLSTQGRQPLTERWISIILRAQKAIAENNLQPQKKP